MEQLLNNINFSTIIWQIITPLIFSAIDILTEYIQEIINKNIDNEMLQKSLLHKCLYIIVILLGYIIQFAFNLKLIAQTITIYICIIELISIWENLKKAGIDLGNLDELLKNNKKEK